MFVHDGDANAPLNSLMQHEDAVRRHVADVVNNGRNVSGGGEIFNIFSFI